jgi:mannose-6-phosphate isomerase-like protein (cupin superfamily)
MPLTDLNEITDARLNRKREPLPFPIEGREHFTRLKEIWAERQMIPIMLHDRDEGLDVTFGGRDSRILLSGDESAGRYCIEDVIYAPGWETSAYHMEEADEHWYVVEGELEITVGNRTETCGEGAFAFIPRNTTRALRNRSSAPTRLFQWSSPAGYDRAVQELAAVYRDNPQIDATTVAGILANYAVIVHRAPVSLPNDARVNAKADHIPFDSHSLEDYMRLREMWASRPMIPKIIHKPSDGVHLETQPGTHSWCILTGDESAGRTMLIVNDCAPSLFMPPHYQPTEEELFYALDEGLSCVIGGHEIKTRKGSFGFAPRYGTHQLANPKGVRGSFLSINSPAGHERGLAKLKDIDLTKDENKAFFDNWGWNVHMGA